MIHKVDRYLEAATTLQEGGDHRDIGEIIRELMAQDHEETLAENATYINIKFM